LVKSITFPLRGVKTLNDLNDYCHRLVSSLKTIHRVDVSQLSYKEMPSTAVYHSSHHQFIATAIKNLESEVDFMTYEKKTELFKSITKLNPVFEKIIVRIRGDINNDAYLRREENH
jgi:hypothetical protein